MLSAPITSAGVRIERQVQPGSWSIPGHPTALAHVLMVLIGNALDQFTQRSIAEPVLTIALQRVPDADVWELNVADNAGGITAEPPSRIFESSFSDKGFGHMGLGLYIASQLVETRLGGAIEARNVGPGARFTIRIPLRTAPAIR